MKQFENQELDLLERENDEQSSDSRQQQRVLLEEIEKQDFFKAQIDASLNNLFADNQTEIHSTLTNSIAIAGIVSQISPADDELTIETLLTKLHSGASEAEIALLIDKGLAQISADIAQGNGNPRKKLAQLFEFMSVVERSLAAQRNPKTQELQAQLQQMRQQVKQLATENNLQNIQSFLKSAELKTNLQQATQTAAQQPDLLRNSFDNIRSINAARQQQQQPLQPQQQQPQQNLAQLQQAAIDRSLAAKAAERLSINQPQVQQSNLNVASRTSQILPTQNQQISTQPNIASLNLARQAQPQVQAQPQQQQAAQNYNNVVAFKPAEQAVEVKQQVQPQIQPEKAPTPADVKIEPKLQEPTKAELKPEVKAEPAEKRGAPPTNAHVHSGDCCKVIEGKSVATEPSKPLNDNVVKLREEVKTAVDKEITPERRSEIAQYSANNAKAADAKFVQNTSQQAQKQASADFGF